MNLLGMRYRLGGRGDDGTIDCLGVVLAKAAELGRPLGDPWANVCADWRAGRHLDYASGFPAGWRRLDGAELAAALRAPRDGDVWIDRGAHDGVGIIAGGRLWSALRGSNVVALDPFRQPQPDEVWRC